MEPFAAMIRTRSENSVLGFNPDLAEDLGHVLFKCVDESAAISRVSLWMTSSSERAAERTMESLWMWACFWRGSRTVRGIGENVSGIMALVPLGPQVLARW